MSKDFDKGVKALGCVGLLVVAPAIVAFYALLDAFVLIRLWRWFVVPTFHLPPLTYSLAVGLSTLVSLVHGPRPTSTDENESWYTPMLRPVVAAGLCLLIGYIAWRLS